MNSTPRTNRKESPTNTEWLQQGYRRELEGRFQKIRRAAVETVADNDALRLGGDPRINQQEDVQSKEEFQFTQDAAKQVAFFSLLEEWINKGLLEPMPREGIESGRHYTSAYAFQAYNQGIKFADDLMLERDMDIDDDDDVEEVVTRVIHADELQRIYIRNYSGLEDISRDMDQSISRILSEGIRDGKGPKEVGNEIGREIEDIQKKRGRTLARTEMLKTHNDSALNRYREFGVSQVEILNVNPCPEICAPIVRNDPYPINDIPKGGPPFHPNCVGSLAPVV